jgi:hypothetical protein
LGLSGA